MTDVFPRRNLPDDGRGNSAEPWGREVEKRIIAVEDTSEALTQSLLGQNRSTASSLTDLAAQVRDLRGRVSYSSGGYDYQEWTATQPDNYGYGSAIDISLTEPRVVSVQFSVNVNALARVDNTSSSAGARITAGVMVDGGVIPITVENMVSASVTGGAGRATVQSLTQEAVATARVLVSLSAGVHNVRGCLTQRRMSVTGTGLAYANVSNYQLIVDVLQTAA